MTDLTFTVAMNKFPDNVTEATTAAAIKTWLDSLTVDSVYEISIEHYAGFWVAICIYKLGS